MRWLSKEGGGSVAWDALAQQGRWWLSVMGFGGSARKAVAQWHGIRWLSKEGGGSVAWDAVAQQGRWWLSGIGFGGKLRMQGYRYTGFLIQNTAA
jgi:hypothetical protein